MNADDIVIEERDAPGRREVHIIFPPGRLADGRPEGVWLGFGHNCLVMSAEHFVALRERLRQEDPVDALGAALAEREMVALAG